MLLNYSVSFKAMDHYIANYNKSQPTLATKVRISMIHTARELLRIYGVVLLRRDRKSPIDLNNLPPLWTNNPQLATLTQGCSRTMQRHLKRLLQAEIITRKVFHGSKRSYELLINPKIIFINGEQLPKTPDLSTVTDKNKNTDNQFFKNNTGTKCPHTDTRNSTRNKNNILMAVNKLQQQLASPQKEITAVTGNIKKMDSLSLHALEKTGNTFTGNTQMKDLQKKSGIQPAQMKEPEREKSFTEAQKRDKLPEKSRSSFSAPYVAALWNLAKEELYKDVHLTKSQCQIALKLLEKWYEPVSKDRLEAVHEIYCARIALVKKYLHADLQNRYVQLPYRYFDPQNPSGFAGTKKWYQSQKQQQKKRSSSRVLFQQIERFKRNERSDTSTSQPRLPLFRSCEQQLKKLKKPELLQHFYQAVLTDA